MVRIAVVGSANVDFIAYVERLPDAGMTVLAHDYRQALGGKGANQAVAAARLGAAVTFITCLGADPEGDLCLNAYRAAGMDVSAIKRAEDAATGRAFINVGDGGGNQIVVVPGANHHLTPADIAAQAAHIQNADTLLIQLEIPLETVSAAVDIAHQAGIPVVLNPAPYRPLPADTLQKVTLLTPNDSEAALLTGNAADVNAALRGLGIPVVVMTQGAEGACILTREGETSLPAIPVQAVDTVGAGDCFSAALTVRYLETGGDVNEAVRFAMAAAAVTVTRPGAQPSLPTRAEVEALLG